MMYSFGVLRERSFNFWRGDMFFPPRLKILFKRNKNHLLISTELENRFQTKQKSPFSSVVEKHYPSPKVGVLG